MLYADRASIFDSRAFRMGLAQLGSHRIPTKPRNPEANGKIEAYHRPLGLWFVKRLPKQDVVDFVHLQQLLDGIIYGLYQSHYHRELKQSPETALAGHVSARHVPPARLVDAFRQEKLLKAHPKTGEVVLDGSTYLVPDELRGQKLTFLLDPPREVPPLVRHPTSGDPLSLRRAAITSDDLDAIDASPVRSNDPSTVDAMTDLIEAAKHDRDTLGGVVEVLAYGVPVGIGSHVHWDRRLDAAIAGALMSIQGIKGVEIGDGFASAARPGSEAHDEIYPGDGRYERRTNRAGGIEGGISNGGIIRASAAMKPISTLMRPLATVDVTTGEVSVAFKERSDVCAVPAAGVVAEQMVAIVLAAEMQRVYGGDTVDAFVEADAAHRRRLSEF
jgi:hypothetical protein